MSAIESVNNKNESKRGSALKYISAIGCIIFLCIPFLFMPHEENITVTRYLLYCVSLLVFVAIFYLNYLWLIKKYLFNKQWLIYFIINIAAIATLVICLQFWQDYIFTSIEPHKIANKPIRIPSVRMRTIFAFRDGFMMLFVAGLAVAIKMTVEWSNAEKARSKIEAEASEAELKNLKNQLNPHFLFNTLNNIYSLTITDTEKAQSAILGLSKILRYVLYDNNQNFVSLEKELSFTKYYIDLMSLRLGDHVTVETHLPKNALPQTNDTHPVAYNIESIQIAPLLFITLIENAFKHGISQIEKSFINIDISITDKSIRCIVKNSYFPKGQSDKSGSGIGTENLRRRLSLQYQNKHRYVTSIKEGIYIADLELEYK